MPILAALFTLTFLALTRRQLGQGLLFWIWTGFTLALFSFLIEQTLGPAIGPAAIVFGVLGSVTCGLSWLLARALFRPADQMEIWPFIVVGGMFVTGVVVVFAKPWASDAGLVGQCIRMSGNAHSLASSTVLLLALVEGLAGLRKSLPKEEARFRIVFTTVYGIMLLAGVVWLRGAMAGSFTDVWGDYIRMVCALAALFGGGLAVWYRGRHPLPETGGRKARKKGPASAEDEALAVRIQAILADEAFLTRSDLKLADLAKRLGEADYKVTRAITAGLGVSNFNRLINHRRIELARQRLAMPEFSHLPVLTIALDCGFGSIGPFNRAFRAETGMTPTDYRRQSTRAEMTPLSSA